MAIISSDMHSDTADMHPDTAAKAPGPLVKQAITQGVTQTVTPEQVARDHMASGQYELDEDEDEFEPDGWFNLRRLLFIFIPIFISLLLLLLFRVSTQVMQKYANQPLSTLAVSDTNTGRPIALAFSPDGKILASGMVGLVNSDGSGSLGTRSEVQLWDVQTAGLLRTLRSRSGELKCITFSPNGRVVAVGSNATTQADTEFKMIGREPTAANQSSILLWDVRTGAPLRLIPGHKAPIHRLNFLPNRRLLALSSLDKRIVLGKTHEPGQLQPIRSIAEVDKVSTVALSPTGRVIANSTLERKVIPIIHLWDVRTGRLLHTLRGHTDLVPQLAFSADGSRLASGVAAQPPNASEIKIWDVDSGSLMTTLNGNTAPVSSLAFSPDNKTLVNGSSDGTVKMWDVPHAQLRRTINSGAPMDALAFTPDGKILSGGGADATVKLWKIG